MPSWVVLNCGAKVPTWADDVGTSLRSPKKHPYGKRRARTRRPEAAAFVQVGRYVRIRTPYLYPDGDSINLYFREIDNVPTVSDLGETMGWLSMQTEAAQRSPRQSEMIQDVCATHGVEFYRGQIFVRIEDERHFASDVTRLAQAVIRIADIVFIMRNAFAASIKDDVAELLEQSKIDFVRDEKLLGRSGRE